MKWLIKILVLGILPTMALSCKDSDHNGRPRIGDDDKISFSASSETVMGLSRAAGDFPNDGSIGIIATYHGQDDWRLYDDFANERATVSSVDVNGVYSFKPANDHFWPFDGSNLKFIAYSPYTTGSNALTLNYDRWHLDMVLQPDMPDVLYAAGNANIPFNKADKTVDLGTFNHALSHLTVTVIADASMNPDIRLTGLSVTTNKRLGSMDLTKADDNIATPIDSSYTFSFASGMFDLNAKDVSGSVLLFPNTQSETYINIALTDGIFSYSNSYRLSDIAQTGEGASGSMRLQRAKKASLTITVSGQTVEKPDDSIRLEGIIENWKYQGNFDVEIN